MSDLERAITGHFAPYREVMFWSPRLILDQCSPGLYIEALLVDEEAADVVWEAWDKGEIDDLAAFAAWSLLASHAMLYLA